MLGAKDLICQVWRAFKDAAAVILAFSYQMQEVQKFILSVNGLITTNGYLLASVLKYRFQEYQELLAPVFPQKG